MIKKKKTDTYHDGAEEFLLDFFAKEPESKLRNKIDNFLSTNEEWALKYHLSEQRKQLIDWIPLQKKATLLEIGAGCGALTGYYCDNVTKVVANELENDRAEIIRRRFSDKKNLKVIQSNIMDLKNEKYDALSVIGVLEYSGKFIKSKNPYLSFLQKSYSLLKKNGIMILAIENKLGLKYFTGCTEDHLGKHFESINDYPIDNGIKTFSKNGLKKLLMDAGFHSISFYYPYPDYKLPKQVVSDEYFLDKDNLIPGQFFHSIDHTGKKMPLINEIALGSELVKNKILSFFSNSFLVIAKV